MIKANSFRYFWWTPFMPYIMILSILSEELGEGIVRHFTEIDCDWLVSMTGTLYGTSAWSEATGCSDVSLSEWWIDHFQ